MSRDYRGHEPESGITNNFWQFGGAHGQGGWRTFSFLLVGLLAIALIGWALSAWLVVARPSPPPARAQQSQARVEPAPERGSAELPPADAPNETGVEPPPASDPSPEGEQSGTPDTGSEGGNSAAAPSDDPPEAGARRPDPPPTEGSGADSEASSAIVSGDHDLMRDAMKLGIRTARHPGLSGGKPEFTSTAPAEPTALEPAKPEKARPEPPRRWAKPQSDSSGE